MIRNLSIRNYAIIDELEIEFADALSIITGETGAGKSILLGALGLIMGQRADTKVLYDESQKCVVEAAFELSAYQMQAFFEENDLDYQAETVVRREITNTGKSRAFINDTPVNLTILKSFCSFLIDLHGQFDTLDIQDSAKQLQVVDALADSKALLSEYRQGYQQYEKLRRELRRLEQQSKQADQDTDFWNFQLSELLEAELEDPEEQEALEQEQKQLSNAEDIKRILGQAAMALQDDEQSVVSQIGDLLHKVSSIAPYHPQLPALHERFEGLMYELEELAGNFQDIAEDTEHDGERLQEVETRLNLFYRLQNKHHVQSLEELMAIQKDLQQKLQGLEDSSARIQELEGLIDREEKKLQKIGQKLSAQRRSILADFEAKTQALLARLSMKYARLSVDLQSGEELLPTGLDQVRFLFSANKGGRLEEIKSVASGGELSRLALCIKSLVAEAITLPTLIFDEIDAGVSGEVAFQMGLILKDLSTKHQVISITHSPQIASRADKHFFVHKVVLEDRTVTSVRPLENLEERILEIAKMLSGNPPSESAKENAKELLGLKTGS